MNDEERKEFADLKKEIFSLKKNLNNISDSTARKFHVLFKNSVFLSNLKKEVIDNVDIEINRRLLKVKDEIVSDTADKLFTLNKSSLVDIRLEVSKIKSDAVKEVNSLFSSGDFLKSFKKNTLRIVEQEVGSQLKDKNIHSLLNDLVVTKLNDNFKEYIEVVAEKTISKIIDKSRFDLDRAKEMKYSADITIKHILQETGISLEKEDFFLECLSAISKDKKLQIENNLSPVKQP